jgi:hypothetical protein
VAEIASESQWQTAIGSALGLESFIQGGNFFLPPDFGYSAAAYFADESPAAVLYVKDFSHHNYPQTLNPGGSGIPGPNLTMLMSHTNTATNVAIYANDTEVTTKLGMDYVFGETNSSTCAPYLTISRRRGSQSNV